MKKECRRIHLLACIAAILLVSPVFAQTTLTVENSTATTASVAVYEVSPNQTQTELYTLYGDQAHTTKLPADGNTIISVQFQQNNANVAGTPVLITNVRLANLMSIDCGSTEVVPPCLALTPARSYPGAKEANEFLAERSTTKEFCLSGSLSTRNDARYFALGNGLIVRLMGKLDDVPANGAACLCGVMGTPPEPLDTIAFDVRSVCRERKAKK